MVKNPPANARDTRDSGSIPRSRRSPGVGNDNPLQSSCLGNPMDREAWLDTVHEAAKKKKVDYDLAIKQQQQWSFTDHTFLPLPFYDS